MAISTVKSIRGRTRAGKENAQHNRSSNVNTSRAQDKAYQRTQHRKKTGKSTQAALREQSAQQTAYFTINVVEPQAKQTLSPIADAPRRNHSLMTVPRH